MSANYDIDLNVSVSMHQDISTNEEENTNTEMESSKHAGKQLPTQHQHGTRSNEHLSHGAREINLHDTSPESTNEEFMFEYENAYISIVFDTSELSSSESENEIVTEETRGKNRKVLTNDERQAIYLALLEKSVNGKLKKNTTRNVALTFLVSMRTVQRIWKRSKQNLENDVVNVFHRKTKNCGRKRIEINTEQFRSLPLQKRTTVRAAAMAMKISPSLIYSNFRYGNIKRHNNSLKPFLTDENKKARLQFCVSMLEEDSLPHDPIFKDMYNVIHIDEKWFNMSKKCEKYYLLSDEVEPYRSCKSKNFVTKVMFLAAVARPRFDAQGNEIFSGKIGIFPFVTKEPAKRRSVNRAAGTIETKAMTSVRRDTVRSVLIKNVIPTILKKWPSEDANNTIYIQQDNAKTHINPNDREFCEAVQQSGYDIKIRYQPPNSPDLNVLDLGFFRAIDSLKYKEAPRLIEERVCAVEKAFEEFSTKLSNRILLTLQSCMEAIMEVRGANSYKIPHMKKAVLEKNGELPCQLKCDAQLYKDVVLDLIFEM